MAATLLRTGNPKHSGFRQLTLSLRRICVPVTAENKTEKSSKEIRRKLKEEGIRTHTLYHMKVKDLAAEFRLKRQEEEKHLNTEQKKKEELRKLEKEMHERVIESVNLENKRMEQQRKEREESKKLLNEERDRKRAEARRKIQARKQQERIELVKKAIEECKNWVTKENLEEKIQYCLEHETNYNFALLPNGEKLHSVSPPGCIDTEENAPGPAACLTTGLGSKPVDQHPVS